MIEAFGKPFDPKTLRWNGCLVCAPRIRFGYIDGRHVFWPYIGQPRLDASRCLNWQAGFVPVQEIEISNPANHRQDKEYENVSHMFQHVAIIGTAQIVDKRQR